MGSWTDKHRPKSAHHQNFIAKAIYEKALIYDIRTTQNGQEAYFIVEIDKAKHASFHRVLQHDTLLSLQDYGTVLYAGWGEPEESLKATLHQTYGMYA